MLTVEKGINMFISLLTDCDFVIFSQHDVAWSEVSVDNAFLFVKIPQSQYQLSRSEAKIAFALLRFMILTTKGDKKFEMNTENDHISCHITRSFHKMLNTFSIKPLLYCAIMGV